ncbi:hypothetical protein DICVIV_03227 [Dictyocaulus viviparus]|uniref:Transcription factor CBF/NF-Y/archaeal histone domain-containing protein n=1 Tax=Dictyocaulus viviparus TaxID=29172 RepID=A0A0D8Y1S2_DICVI|nr:hypothetical protein DICVIV_03227 [Dictyocaulus viviparus]
MSDLISTPHEENPGPSNPNAVLSSISSSTAGPIRRRRFSAAKIQPTRIKKVMQSDEEIGRMVASVPVAIGRAMEHFAEKFLQLFDFALVYIWNELSILLGGVFKIIGPIRVTSTDILKEVAVPGSMGVDYDPSLARQQMVMLQMKPNSWKSDELHSKEILQAGLPTITPGSSSASPVCSPCNPISPMAAGVSSPLGIPTSPNAATYAMSIPSSVTYNVPYPTLLQNIAGTGQGQPMSMQYVPSMVNMTTPTSPSVVTQTLSARKALNGKKVEISSDGEKPKRGRPRKIKRSEKCLDEDLCEEVTNGIEKEDQDRALMPPPALPLGRARPVA